MGMDKVLYGKIAKKRDRAAEQTAGSAENRETPAELTAGSVGQVTVYSGREQTVIDEKDVARGRQLLREYMKGKEMLDGRLIEDEKWWEMRHWEVLRKKAQGDKEKNADVPKPASAWLFNTIVSKHADAMDNYPVPVVLPREKSDESSAKILSSVLPVVLDSNNFDAAYDRNWWEKLKHGACAYGVFWDNDKNNGLGDIAVRDIDLLRMYWEPGITDLEKSRNLFILELRDTDEMEAQYPQYKGKFGGDPGSVKEYLYNENIDNTKKCVVADWYYKVKLPSGRIVLHYVKFCGDVLLYASENQEEYRETGYYAHGCYPVVLDILYPEKGTPAGFGYVSVCKDPQMYIDAISANIQESTLISSKTRYFASDSANINTDEFMDISKPLVHVTGDISDTRLKQIVVNPVDPVAITVMNQKIEEMKETAANRDMNNGGGGRGVTAAAAIAALQEAGNKTSRDMISASYRVYRRIASLCVELMRQFYDEARAFRVVSPNDDGYRFVSLSNDTIKEQPVESSGGQTLYRLPIFDYKIMAQKKNPFSRMEQNELAKEFFRLGMLSPDRAEEASRALDMMDFEGIDKVRAKVEEGKTLLKVVEQMGQQIAAMQETLQRYAASAAAAAPAETGTPAAPAAQSDQPPDSGPRRPLTDAVLEARTPMTGYGQNLAKRSVPTVEGA